jgi:hypothetical protein
VRYTVASVEQVNAVARATAPRHELGTDAAGGATTTGWAIGWPSVRDQNPVSEARRQDTIAAVAGPGQSRRAVGRGVPLVS